MSEQSIHDVLLDLREQEQNLRGMINYLEGSLRYESIGFHARSMELDSLKEKWWNINKEIEDVSLQIEFLVFLEDNKLYSEYDSAHVMNKMFAVYKAMKNK